MTPEAPVVTGGGRSPARSAALAVAALVGWAALIAVGRVWGMHLEAEGRKIVLFAPPILAGYRLVLPPFLWVGIIAGAAAAVSIPWLARRLSWAGSVTAMAVGSLVWTVALAAVDGTSGLTGGLGWDTEYEPFMPSVAADPLGFVRGFVPAIRSYSIQIRGHPPGFVVLLGVLDRIGLKGPGWATALVLVGAASAVPAVLLALREVADEGVARRAAPFVAVAPAALWVGTSLDALFVGVTAWSVTCVLLAMRRTGRRADVLAVVGGLLAAAALLLSYGLVLVFAVVGVVALARRRDPGTWRPILVAAAVGSIVLVACVPLGFWWFDGLAATREEYRILDVDRPFSYFVVNNLSAWAIALGPAVAVALVWLRDRRVWLLVGGGLAAALLADASGLSEGEVERIWLPFTVWVLASACALGRRVWSAQLWLGLQVATALVVTSLVRTLW